MSDYFLITDFPFKIMVFINFLTGVTTLIFSEIMLFKDIEPFSSWFFCFAWWSYIFIVDSIVFFRNGNSLILTRTKEFFFLLPVSIFIWLIFEGANLFLKNWYYINVIEVTPLRWAGYCIAFATVLPAIFETAELLETTHLFTNISIRAKRFSTTTRTVFITTGTVSLLLSVVFPKYCFALIWGSFVFLLDPVNYQLGAPSLLKGLEKADIRKPCILMLSGLVCGVLWEFWNYWATTKWVYTVPFLESFKIFEMTVLGFLGFIPFALECYVMTSFVRHLFRNIYVQEKNTYILSRGKYAKLFLQCCLIPFFTIFCISMFHAIDTRTVDSYRPLILKMQSIKEGHKKELEQLGFVFAKDLLQLKYSKEKKAQLINALGISKHELSEWISEAELAMVKGMGIRNLSIIKKAGIKNICDLASQSPTKLHTTLENLSSSKIVKKSIPDRTKLMIWIQEAKRLSKESNQGGTN